MVRSGACNQFLATLTCNLITLSYGTSCAWTGPNFMVLTSDETPLATGPLTVSEASIVVSLLCAGGIFGSILYAYLVERCSRRTLMVSLAVPQIIAWALIYFATNVYYLYVSRFIAGTIGGGIFLVAPVYVSEIADDGLRGTLGSMMIFICSVGVLIEFVIANFASYYVQIRILAIIPVMFLSLFSLFPETPEYLLRQNHILLAQQSRNFYQGETKPAALDAMIANSKEEKSYALEPVVETGKGKEEKSYDDIESDKLSFSDFCLPAAKKATLIAMFLTTLNQFCGAFAMLNYTNKIFQEAGSNLSPNGSSIVVAAVQLFANASTMILVDRAGRKILLSLSSVGTATGLICMGLHDLYKAELAAYNWLPIVSFSMIIFSASAGILPLTFVIFMEILPKKIKSVVTMTALITNWGLAFVLVLYYPWLTQEIGMYNCMFGFAVCCVAGLIFTLFVIPETKGKSYEAIMKALE